VDGPCSRRRQGAKRLPQCGTLRRPGHRAQHWSNLWAYQPQQITTNLRAGAVERRNVCIRRQVTLEVVAMTLPAPRCAQQHLTYFGVTFLSDRLCYVCNHNNYEMGCDTCVRTAICLWTTSAAK